MATFMIGYDLTKKGEHDYAKLFDAIRALDKASWHCLDSTWIIRTNLTAVQVRANLWAHMHANDRLLVASISKPADWSGFNKACDDWLKMNL